MAEIALPFMVHKNDPTLLEVETRGKKYEVRVHLAVFEVSDLGGQRPGTDLPMIGIKANVGVEVVEKKP